MTLAGKTLLLLLAFLSAIASSTDAAGAGAGAGGAMNAVDACWRRRRTKISSWSDDRQRLALCSVGYAGKMTGNAGPATVPYVVTDPGDDPLRPKPGTLRYGATMLRRRRRQPVWITFSRDMVITLREPLLVRSFTAIDGRGADVHIAGGAGFFLYGVSDVIVHGLNFHDLKATRSPGRAAAVYDGDALRLVGSTKVWIDHNTFYRCQDGLLDVTRASTGVTVTNNWFKDHNKVMLLGHDDSFLQDRGMKVTVAFNVFGPNCTQRMPRVRHGYAHVVNNLYQGWGLYAIGGSMSPTIRSEGNLFVAPDSGGNKEATSRIGGGEGGRSSFVSVGDAFENGASFRQSGGDLGGPRYNRQQSFAARKAGEVRMITRNAGALRCSTTSATC